MFVGLKRFSIICTRVLLSTPGNMDSTDSITPDALSPIGGIRECVGNNVLRGFGSVKGCSSS